MSDIEYERLRRGATALLTALLRALDIDESDDAAGLVLAAAEVLADLGPVLDALVAACDAPATDDGMAAIALRLVELRTAWTTARAKLVTT